MLKVLVDFSKCKTGEEMHQELKKKLEFPDYYGKNCDALWDCLTDIFDPMEITMILPKRHNVDINYELQLIRETLEDYVKKYSFSKVIFLEESE